MPACHLKPRDKKSLISAVGRDLVRKRGKRNYYALSDIRDSVKSSGYPVDVACWAYCVYGSPTDFTTFHEAAGEVCSYFAMRAEILPDLASGMSFSWSDLDLSWLEWPDIDLSSMFDWFDAAGG